MNERIARHATVSAALAGMDDASLLALIDEAPAPVTGVGGTTRTITADGVPVFVKQVPLTEKEQRNPGSTANLFGLPPFYQYGVGSAGFGVWRELAAHTMTTGWVLDRSYDGFPLLHHWRVLPRRPQPMTPADLDGWVNHWEGDGAVRERLEAISDATATVVLFLEHLPHTVDSWLETALTGDPARTGQDLDALCGFVDRELRAGADFLASRGLLHGDAHFRNLLTDGRRIYFADFGLAVHPDFDLDPAEKAFLAAHRDYDRAYVRSFLAEWLVHKLHDIPWSDILVQVGRHTATLPPAAAGHAPVTALMADFHHALLTRTKRTPFPADAIRAALAGEPHGTAKARWGRAER